MGMSCVTHLLVKRSQTDQILLLLHQPEGLQRFKRPIYDWVSEHLSFYATTCQER